MPSADACRPGADAAARQAADRLLIDTLKSYRDTPRPGADTAMSPPVGGLQTPTSRRSRTTPRRCSSLHYCEEPGHDRQTHLFRRFPNEEKVGYARAAVVDGWVFVSGTTGFDAETKQFPPDAVSQCENCFRNIERALKEAGTSLAESGARADFPRQRRGFRARRRRSSASTAMRRGRPTPRCSPRMVIAADAGRNRGDGEDRALTRQSQNAKVRVSMLSRGGALGGVLGSSNAECAVKRVATFGSVSNTLNTIASLRSICGKWYQTCSGL